MKTIEIYGRDHCKYCNNAKRLIEERGLAYVYRDIVADPALRSELLARNPRARTVPQIFVGDTLIGGFDELAALDPLILQQMVAE